MSYYTILFSIYNTKYNLSSLHCYIFKCLNETVKRDDYTRRDDPRGGLRQVPSMGSHGFLALRRTIL